MALIERRLEGGAPGANRLLASMLCLSTVSDILGADELNLERYVQFWTHDWPLGMFTGDASDGRS